MAALHEARRVSGGSKISEEVILQLKGRDWLRLSRQRQEQLVEASFKYWRKRGFPYFRLTQEAMRTEFERLCSVPSHRILLGNEVQMSMVGLSLANYFHPQMWSVPVHRWRSPMERFNDDRALRKILRKALTIWPDRCAVNECNLRRILKTYSHTAGVSNFRPSAAKALYERYSRDGDVVLDFSAGYGGRLLGCLPLDRFYLGVDPCKAQVQGLKKMAARLRTVSQRTQARVAIYGACAEEFLPTVPANSVALVFSSPPYFNLERYSSDSSQSYVRYPQYRVWLEQFLTRVVEESHRVLRPSGYLLMNVANVKGYSLCRDAQRIGVKYLVKGRPLKLRLGNKPYLRSSAESAYKYESILAFRKSD